MLPPPPREFGLAIIVTYSPLLRFRVVGFHPSSQSLRAIQVEIKGAAGSRETRGEAPDKGAKQGFMTVTD